MATIFTAPPFADIGEELYDFVENKIFTPEFKPDISGADMEAILEGKSLPKGRKWTHAHDMFENALTFKSWRRILFRQLTISELLILNEASRPMSLIFANRSDNTMQESVAAFLASPRLSANIKLAMCCNFSYPCVGNWLLSDDEGRNIPKFFEVMANQEEENDPHVIFSSLVEIAINRYEGRYSPKVRGVVLERHLSKLCDEVVTQELMESLTPLVERNKTQFTFPISSLARRLYGFDESLPDEWVIRAIA